MDIESAITELQEAIVAIAHLEKHQTEMQKLQATELEAVRTLLQDGLRTHEREMRDHSRRMRNLDERIDDLVSGFGEYIRRTDDERAEDRRLTSLSTEELKARLDLLLTRLEKR
jgi:predicted transcriptional regulator